MRSPKWIRMLCILGAVALTASCSSQDDGAHDAVPEGGKVQCVTFACPAARGGVTVCCEPPLMCQYSPDGAAQLSQEQQDELCRSLYDASPE